MSNASGQIRFFVPDKFIIDERPSWLTRYPATVSGDAYYVKGLTTLDQPVDQKVIVYPDVIVDKNNYIWPVWRRDALVKYVRETALVQEGNLGDKSSVMGDAKQGNAQGRFFPKFISR
jgi:hypothetical protein